MRSLIVVSFLFLSAMLCAQRTEKEKKVKVEYTMTYYADQSLTLDQAKIMAIEEAKTMAIDSVFGRKVSKRESSIGRNGNGHSAEEYMYVSNGNISGRWINDIEEPKFGTITFDNDLKMINIPITVKGYVKEIKRAPIQCEVKVLCEDMERTDFVNGNKLRLSFTSPEKGYLVVYLVDESNNVFRALPYYNQEDGAYAIKKNKEYLFFSKKDALDDDKPYVEEYALTTTSSAETDLLYVIFSPNKFSHPVDKFVDEEHTNQLSWKEFQKWLGSAMTDDEDMMVIGNSPIMIRITNPSFGD